MINLNSAVEIKQYIKKHKFYIFGTGFVAENLLGYLENNDIQSNLVGFLETQPKKSEFNNFPVYKLDTISYVNNVSIIVAAHSSIFEQIKMLLESKGITEWIWIYPYWYELLFGCPYKKNLIINPYSVIQKACFSERVMCSIYLLGIGYVFNQNRIGKSVFFKFSSLFSSNNTIEKRWESFSDMVTKFDETNISHLGNLLVATDAGFIIDGNHRIALALYKRIPRIYVDLFHANYEDVSYIFKKLMLNSEDVNSLFSREECDHILLLTDELVSCNDISEYCKF